MHAARRGWLIAVETRITRLPGSVGSPRRNDVWIATVHRRQRGRLRLARSLKRVFCGSLARGMVLRCCLLVLSRGWQQGVGRNKLSSSRWSEVALFVFRGRKHIDFAFVDVLGVLKDLGEGHLFLDFCPKLLIVTARKVGE